MTSVGSPTRASRSLHPIDFLAAVLAPALVLVAARADHHRRRAWYLLAGALGLYALSIASVLQLDSLSTPRPSDIVRLVGTATLVGAAALITRNVNPSSRRSDPISE